LTRKVQAEGGGGQSASFFLCKKEGSVIRRLREKSTGKTFDSVREGTKVQGERAETFTSKERRRVAHFQRGKKEKKKKNFKGPLSRDKGREDPNNKGGEEKRIPCNSEGGNNSEKGTLPRTKKKKRKKFTQRRQRRRRIP